MRDKTFQIIGRSIIIVASFLYACDLFQEDTIQKDKQVTINAYARDYYILPNTSTVIDLKALVNSSFTNATIKISENPLRGNLTKLDDFLLKYNPQTGFMGGVDQFSISFSNNGTVLKTTAITIHMRNDTADFPCALYTVEDYAFTNPDSSVSIKFIYNDRVCGIAKSEIQASIHSQPKNGQAKIVGDAIIYSPSPRFIGRDSLVYKITADANLNTTDNAMWNESYGIISLQIGMQMRKSSRWTILPKWLHDARCIFFTDEKTGFVGGSESLYKTSNGGMTWRNTFPILNDRYNYQVTDIDFYDSDHGFAVYYRFDNAFSQVGGGVINTDDGGETWREEPILTSTSHTVHFISTLTGFMATNFGMYKTVDGGRNWKLVYNDVGGGIQDICFLNTSTGFASSVGIGGSIVKTNDGGESWHPSGYVGLIRAFATNGNSLFAVSGNLYGSGNDTTILWRSGDGENWSEAFEQVNIVPADFAFSPHGTLGMEVGQSSHGDKWGPGALVSHDGGATWQYEIFDNNPFFLKVTFNSVSIPSERMAYVLAADDGDYPILLRYEIK